jgi:hypothetical protein
MIYTLMEKIGRDRERKEVIVLIGNRMLFSRKFKRKLRSNTQTYMFC